MISGALPPQSRIEHFPLQIELRDEDANDEPIDISDATEISILIVDQCGSHDRIMLSATLSAGQITQPQLGVIECVFTDAQMKTLRVGTYNISGTLTKDGQTVQFMNATLPVIGPRV